MTFKPYPKIRVIMDGDTPRLVDKDGRDVMSTKEGAERLAECWNACAALYSPAAHIEASKDRIERLEQLRKDAWARVQEAERALMKVPS